MALNYLAPAPYASFVTRNGSFQADGNALISNVGAGPQALDLLEGGCVPLAFNPFANFRNLIDGGDFSINPFQRNIPGIASGGVIATPIAATPTYFADRFFVAGGASSAILAAAAADASVPGFNQSLKISRQSGNSSTAMINVGQVVETFELAALPGADDHALVLGADRRDLFRRRARRAARRGIRHQPERREPHRGKLDDPIFRGQCTTDADFDHDALSVHRRCAVERDAARRPPVVHTERNRRRRRFDFDQRRAARDRTERLALRAHRRPGRAQICQRYAWAIPEPAAGVVIGAGANTGAAAQLFYMATPVQLLKAPTVTVAAGSFKTNQAGAASATTITPGGTHTPNAISINGNSTGTAGQATLLQGGGGSGWIIASADF